VNSFGHLQAWARWLGAVVVPPCQCVEYMSPRTRKTIIQVTRSQIDDPGQDVGLCNVMGTSSDRDADYSAGDRATNPVSRGYSLYMGEES
jgi:hypothetical protein